MLELTFIFLSCGSLCIIGYRIKCFSHAEHLPRGGCRTDARSDIVTISIDINIITISTITTIPREPQRETPCRII